MSSFTTSINLLLALPLGVLPACQFHRQPPSINTFTSPPLHISQPSRSDLSDVIWKASNMCCVPGAAIPDLMHRDHSHRELQHLHLWQSTWRCSALLLGTVLTSTLELRLKHTSPPSYSSYRGQFPLPFFYITNLIANSASVVLFQDIKPSSCPLDHPKLSQLLQVSLLLWLSPLHPPHQICHTHLHSILPGYILTCFCFAFSDHLQITSSMPPLLFVPVFLPHQGESIRHSHFNPFFAESTSTCPSAFL